MRAATGCHYLSLPPRLIMLIRVDPLTGCWTWQGAKSGPGSRGSGYGRAKYLGERWSSHILVRWLLSGRRLGSHLVHDHECCNRACCRPGLGHVMARSHVNNCRLREKRSRALKRKSGHNGALRVSAGVLTDGTSLVCVEEA